MKIIAIAAICVLTAAPLRAQDNGPIVWPFSFGRMGISKVQEKTGINEVQMRKIQELYRANRDSMIDQRAEVEKAEAALRELLDAPQVDLAAAEQALNRALQARTALSRSSSLMMLKMRQELTQEQWRKLQELAPPPPPPPAPPAAPASAAPAIAPGAPRTPAPGKTPAAVAPASPAPRAVPALAPPPQRPEH